MKRPAAGGPAAPPRSGLGRWLVVGRALVEPAPVGVTVARARGVHEALDALAWRRFERVRVDAASIADQPRAALRALRKRAPDSTLEVVASAPDARLERAAEAVGAEVVDGVAAPLAPAAVPPEARGRVAPSAPPAPPPALPRADDARAAPRPPVPEDFAAECLARVERPRALATFLLRAFAQVSDAARVSLLLRGARGTLVLRAGRGVDAALLGKVRVALGTGVAGRTAALGRPALGSGAAGGARAYPGGAYAVLPLPGRRACEGVVCLTGFPGDRAPSGPDVESWMTWARQAGQALAASRRLHRASTRSTRDALTRLPNRRAFEHALRRELDRATRASRGLAVALLDVDRFKSINDRHGHPAGDEVLREVARRLAGAFREYDLVARWGGEEFVVLLPDLGTGDGEVALAAVERARRAVSARPIALGAGLGALHVTISGGVALGPRDDAPSGQALLRAADDALLRAKHEGRDRVLAG